jgi:SAM-dependent methyltransferase
MSLVSRVLNRASKVRNAASSTAPIDPNDLITAYSVDEMNEAANQYFMQWAEHPSPILAKPFTDLDESPELLASFGQLVQGLNLSPGDVVLDFGAGACWTTRFLVQMGFDVIALDVSEQALELGRELFRSQPVFGETLPPRFLAFDGKRIDLPADSVDAIFCNDAFHHVPNPAEVLMEFGRIARPGAIGGFSEPGPDHATSAGAQAEMRNFGVIERNIVIEEIWEQAQQAGCSDMRVAIFNAGSCLVSPSEFNRGLASESGWESFRKDTQQFLHGRRMFFLYWPPAKRPDSRRSSGLSARIELPELPESIAVGATLSIQLEVHNTGTSVWMPSDARFGPVRLGVMRRDGNREGDWIDYGRFDVQTSNGAVGRVDPGESGVVDAIIPGLSRGKHQIRLDILSERVAWFGNLGSPVIEFDIMVLD